MLYNVLPYSNYLTLKSHYDTKQVVGKVVKVVVAVALKVEEGVKVVVKVEK
mgnify:CR=1 FL=1